MKAKPTNKVSVSIQAICVHYTGDAEGAQAVIRQIGGLISGMVDAAVPEQPALPRKRRKAVPAEITAERKAVKGPGDESR